MRPSDPTRSVVIQGIGACTPLGGTARQTWQSLLDGKFISDHAGAPIDLPMPRVHGLALCAAREAIADAGWNEFRNVAVAVGTSKGPVESWLSFTPACADVGDLSSIATHLSNELGLTQGPRLTFSAACASGLHALIRGAMLIQTDEAHRALIVAAESSIHPLFIGSFQRLGVLAPPGFGCRPMDVDRSGFLISEAAAAVCLERGETGIRIDGFALGGDAEHLTRCDPGGRTLRRLLADVIGNRPVDLIHAHATGTKINDAVELAAIQSALPDSSGAKPILYSHKGALGHSLGAAGLVSIVLNYLAHKEGRVPPNARTRNPLPMDGLRFPAAIVESPIRRSIAIASGFGGPIAVVGMHRS